MKKLGLLVMPLMAVSLLASCGGDKPLGVTYTLTFNCENCKVYDENDIEIKNFHYVTIVDTSQTLYQKFRFEGEGLYEVPLKSNILIKKADSGEKVDFEYVNGYVSIPIISNLTINAAGSSAKVLEKCSWDEISEISETGRADDFFDIGDTKTINIFNVEHETRIIDFNHDVDENGNPIGITFEFSNVFTASDKGVQFAWDESGNNFDYRKSSVSLGFEELISELPEELSKVLKYADKKVAVSINAGKSFSAKSFDKGKLPRFFLLAHDEVTKTKSDFALKDEGSIYRYYDEGGSQAKRDAKGNDAMYWLRSPCISETSCVWFVDEGGELVKLGILGQDYFCVAPAFCI